MTARILFEKTHGIDVNTRIKIRDQERAPITAYAKRSLREKAKQEEPTFALTADIPKHTSRFPLIFATGITSDAKSPCTSARPGLLQPHTSCRGNRQQWDVPRSFFGGARRTHVAPARRR